MTMATKEPLLLVPPTLDRNSNGRSVKLNLGSRYVQERRIRSSTRRRRHSMYVPTIHNMPVALFLMAFIITQWSIPPSGAASFVPDYARNTQNTQNTNTHTLTQNTHSTQLECQLLGMNCATPTEFALTWPGFCQRGGETDVHRDGWGRKYYTLLYLAIDRSMRG
jgi:hypothetical protein